MSYYCLMHFLKITNMFFFSFLSFNSNPCLFELSQGFMETRKISVFCYWNGCIKDGPFYEGSTPRVIRVESRTDLPTLLSDLHRVTEFEKGKFQMDVIGRYPSVVQQPMVKSMRLPIVDDSSLETMLEVPSYHSSINSVELYLEVKPVSHGP